MPLLSFSISSHIPLLFDGRKVQTTRQPRKNPLKVGDVLYCYYKPRQKPSCNNCIAKCPYEKGGLLGITLPCDKWSNCFGEATVTRIYHYWKREYWEKDIINELYFVTFGHLCQDDEGREIVEEWARNDGFANLDEASKYFSKSDINTKWKKVSWMCMNWDVIIFEPKWLKEVKS